MWEPPGAGAPWQEDDPAERRTRITVRVHADGTATDIAVDGELDIATVPMLRRALYDAAWGPGTVRVDLRRATFMDLPSLRVLLEADRALTAGGRRLVVVTAPGRRPRVMTVLPLAQELTVEEHPPGGTP